MKNNVVMIFTGGTIAMEVDSDIDAAIPSVGGNELMNMVKDVSEVTDFETIDFSNIPSPHMTPSIMLELSKVVNENVSRDDVTGVVITHGTDTLEETSYFLDLIVDTDKPVILCGAMKNNSELGYDGAANIAAAIYTACAPEAKNKGVLVVMNNEIHNAREVIKTNTVALDTFKSPQFGPIGVIENDEVKIWRDIVKKEKIDTNTIEDKVALIKSVAGMGSDVIDFYIESGYKGLVVEALGCGNLPPAMVPGLQNAIDKDIPVILVSRCINGSVVPVYGYEAGGKELHDMGLILGGNLSGPKARIKLIILLGMTKDLDTIKSYFG